MLALDFLSRSRTLRISSLSIEKSSNGPVISRPSKPISIRISAQKLPGPQGPQPLAAEITMHRKETPKLRPIFLSERRTRGPV